MRSEAEIAALRRRADALIWYHAIDLGDGVVTRGIYDHRPYLERFGIPSDLRGRTALDIGAASGFFSFEMERRGAAVTATDLPAWMGHDFGPDYVPDLTEGQAASYLRDPFLLAKEALGSSVERREINVYDLSPETVGTFDLVFCGSVLLHLTDPFRALMRIRSVTRGTAIVSTAFRDSGVEPTALFVGDSKAATWWMPNRACLEIMMRSAGFRTVEWTADFRLDYRDGTPGHPHGVIHGRVG